MSTPVTLLWKTHIPVCHIPGAKLDHVSRDRCILDDRATSWAPSVIVEGAWVRMTPSPVVLLDSHHYLEPPAHAFAAHSILSQSPPKFHCPDIPLDAEVLHGAARYLPAVLTDATTPIPPFLRPLSHLTNFISRLKRVMSEGCIVSLGGVERAE
ncbi:hypothetical protein DFH08DRAFT_967601 [Mycena albidolilacea]|uniref:Uncharacterized protein n=1 Tax=Mycena albidolilacea TaxID=1033008 RepID=A0AAD6ZLQ4_9AGAR|nr:hypothetical protein DFH08DRAFT_967601 [Mycena albidolilacea]